MKIAKIKSDGLQLAKGCKCKLNLKAGEIGLRLSVKERGKEIKHYTAKGKRKNAEYFLGSLVKTYLKVLNMPDDIDLVKYEDVTESITKKESKDLSNNEKQTNAMLGIQKEIDEASKKCEHNKIWGTCKICKNGKKTNKI